jgi:hypothetical protein
MIQSPSVWKQRDHISCARETSYKSDHGVHNIKDTDMHKETWKRLLSVEGRIMTRRLNSYFPLTQQQQQQQNKNIWKSMMKKLEKEQLWQSIS